MKNFGLEKYIFKNDSNFYIFQLSRVQMLIATPVYKHTKLDYYP